MSSDIYKSIAGESSGEYKEKGSKFFGYASPVTDEQNFKEFLEKVRSEHHQARHHCFAYRLSPDSGAFRSSDDREPSGSAGKPILGQILSFDLYEVGIVVVRYFGGTLLGVPGLIRSYKAGARLAIESAKIIEKTVEQYFTLEFDYDHTSEIMNVLNTFESRMIKQEYGSRCKFLLAVKKSNAGEFSAKLLSNHILADKIKLESVDKNGIT